MPGHRLGADQSGEQIELVLEQHLVLREVEAEQRKGLDERAAAERYLGAPVRRGIERREALEHPDRIVGRQNGNRRAKMDALGPAGDGGEDHFRRGDGKI